MAWTELADIAANAILASARINQMNDNAKDNRARLPGPNIYATLATNTNFPGQSGNSEPESGKIHKAITITLEIITDITITLVGRCNVNVTTVYFWARDSQGTWKAMQGIKPNIGTGKGNVVMATTLRNVPKGTRTIQYAQLHSTGNQGARAYWMTPAAELNIMPTGDVATLAP